MRAFMAGALFFCLLGGSAQAATRYVAPTGSGDACSPSEPCALATGIDGAAADDTVLVGSGTYGSPAAFQTYFVARRMSIRGATIGPARPVVYGQFRFSDANGSFMSDIEVRNPLTGPSVNAAQQITMTRMLVRATTTNAWTGCRMDRGSTLTNSVCTSMKTGSEAGFSIESSSGQISSARHVTGIGQHFGAYTGGEPMTLSASILRGAFADLRSNASLSLRSVAFNTSVEAGPMSNLGQVSAPPVFRDEAGGDYRQAPNSPTIDAGDLADASVAPGELDLNGNLRRLGANSDIGGYEHVPAAPTGTTDAPSNVTSSSAQLNATVDGKGGAITYRFEYGPTTSYGSSTPDQFVVGSATASSLSAPLNLPAGTTHYRVVATTDAGTVTGGDRTVGPLPVVSAADATNVGAATATLNGFLGSATADVRFRYGKVGQGLTSSTAYAPRTSGPLSTAITGLEPATSYRFVIDAVNGFGTSTTEQVSFTTLPEAPTASVDDAASITTTGASLSGSANIKQAPSGSARFVIDGVAQDPQALTASGPVAQTLTGLAPGSTHTYKLRVTTTGGTVESTEKQFTTLPDGPSATAGDATNVTATSATLPGTVDLKQAASGQARFLLDGTPQPVQDLTASGPVTQALTGLAPATTYTYKLRVTTAGGTVESTEKQFTTLPAAPTATVGEATAVTASSATLPGTVDLKQAAAGQARFVVNGDPTPAQDVTSGAVSADLTGLTPATTYTYKLRVTTTGGTVESTEKQFTTLPAAPTATVGDATAVTASSATLPGTVDLRQASSGQARFVVNGDLTPAQDVSSGPVSADLTSLSPATTYTYKLRVTTAGGTVESAEKQFTTLPEAPTATAGDATDVTATSAKLPGTADLKQAAAGKARFVIAGEQTAEQGLTASGPVGATVTGLAPNTAYEYRLRVVTAGGSAESAPKTFRTLPAVPSATALPATNVALRSATLRGTVDTRGVPGAARFVLDGQPQTVVATEGGELTLDVGGLEPNTEHTYFVRLATQGGIVDSAPVTFRTAKALYASLRVAKSFVQSAISIKRRIVRAVVRCGNLPCAVELSGMVVAGDKRIGRLGAPGKPTLVEAGTSQRARLRISKKLTRRVLKASRRKPRPQILITGRFTASDGTVVERSGTMGVRAQR